MKTSKLPAEETVSVSELCKNPSRYFTDHPIAVMVHNKAIGYVIGAELFESMMALIDKNQAAKAVTGEFRPVGARLKDIAVSCVGIKMVPRAGIEPAR